MNNTRVLVSGQTAYLRELAATAAARYLGVLLQPNQYNDIRTLLAMGLPLAIDNAAYSNPNPRALWNLFVESWELLGYVRWVAVPDVVGDAEATLACWAEFRAALEYEIGYVPPVPLAFVAQNGSERMLDRLPWDDFACLFVGGTKLPGDRVDWKLGPGAIAVCDEARRRGKLIHVGRVNGAGRLRYARDVLGADSVDGTGVSRFARVKLPPLLKALGRSPAATLF